MTFTCMLSQPELLFFCRKKELLNSSSVKEFPQKVVVISGRYDSKLFVSCGILAARFVLVFTKKLLNLSAIDFLPVISSLTIVNLLGKKSFCTLNFSMIDFLIFQEFSILFSHFVNLLWNYNFFDCFLNFHTTFINLVCFFIF